MSKKTPIVIWSIIFYDSAIWADNFCKITGEAKEGKKIQNWKCGFEFEMVSYGASTEAYKIYL